MGWGWMDKGKHTQFTQNNRRDPYLCGLWHYHIVYCIEASVFTKGHGKDPKADTRQPRIVAFLHPSLVRSANKNHISCFYMCGEERVGRCGGGAVEGAALVHSIWPSM